jgi:hypothetical protein
MRTGFVDGFHYIWQAMCLGERPLTDAGLGRP